MAVFLRMHGESGPGEREAPQQDLARALEALASPLRLALLHRLARPAFIRDLARELGVTRQAVTRHLEELERVGLVVGRPSRRGALPATEYRADPAGLFAFKESVLALALPADALPADGSATRLGSPPAGRPGRGGPGLLLVHGDAPGRWYPLSRGSSWILGRDPRNDVCLSYDPFASARHALLGRDGATWSITDLHATNGTFLDFVPLAPGETRPLRSGSVVTIGRSRLLFQEGA